MPLHLCQERLHIWISTDERIAVSSSGILKQWSSSGVAGLQIKVLVSHCKISVELWVQVSTSCPSQSSLRDILVVPYCCTPSLQFLLNHISHFIPQHETALNIAKCSCRLTRGPDLGEEGAFVYLSTQILATNSPLTLSLYVLTSTSLLTYITTNININTLTHKAFINSQRYIFLTMKETTQISASPNDAVDSGATNPNATSNPDATEVLNLAHLPRQPWQARYLRQT